MVHAAGMECGPPLAELLGHFSAPQHAPSTCRAGSAAQPIWLNNVFCRGDEQKLEGCIHSAWGDGSCPGHSKDVGIACNATGEACS